MGRKQEIAGSVRALLNNVDLVSEAVFENRGAIPLREETLNAADILVKHRLAFRTEEFGTQVNSAVMRLVYHVTKNHRLKLSSGAVADLLNGLRAACESYRTAVVSGDRYDQQNYEAEIYEQVFELVDLLQSLVQQFANRVYNEFSGISTLELKIRENERSIKEISNLNTLFSEFNINELVEMAGNDPLLNRLLLKQLKQVMDECRKELVATAAMLREMLAKMQRDLEAKRLNRLVDCMYEHYQRVPNFKPDIGCWEMIPDCCNRAAPLAVLAHADIWSEVNSALMEALARDALRSRTTAPEQGKSRAVIPVGVVDDEYIEDTPEPIYEAVDCFFDALSQPGGPNQMSGSHGYTVLSPGVGFDIWLMALVSHFQAQGESLQRRLVMEYLETRPKGYSGNRVVDDLIFTRLTESSNG